MVPAVLMVVFFIMFKLHFYTGSSKRSLQSRRIFWRANAQTFFPKCLAAVLDFLGRGRLGRETNFYLSWGETTWRLSGRSRLCPNKTPALQAIRSVGNAIHRINRHPVDSVVCIIHPPNNKNLLKAFLCTRVG